MGLIGAETATEKGERLDKGSGSGSPQRLPNQLAFLYAASVSAMVLSKSFLVAILRARLSLICDSLSVKIRRSLWIFCFSSSS